LNGSGTFDKSHDGSVTGRPLGTPGIGGSPTGAPEGIGDGLAAGAGFFDAAAAPTRIKPMMISGNMEKSSRLIG
jgi:hypothetical protein